MRRHAELIRFLANVSEIQRITDEGALPPTAMQIDRRPYDPRAAHEPDRRSRRRARASCEAQGKARQELTKCEAKLANQNFVANAPAEIVEQERARIADFTREIDQIEEQERRVALLKREGKR